MFMGQREQLSKVKTTETRPDEARPATHGFKNRPRSDCWLKQGIPALTYFITSHRSKI